MRVYVTLEIMFWDFENLMGFFRESSVILSNRLRFYGFFQVFLLYRDFQGFLKILRDLKRIF